MGNRYDAFLSYSRHDLAWVEWLHTMLEECGKKVWFDQQDLVGGALFGPQLEQGMVAGHMLLVVSPASVLSSWALRERSGFAAYFDDQSAHRLIPVLLHKAPLPPMLAAVDYIDFTQGEYRDNLRKLLGAMEPVPKALRDATLPPDARLESPPAAEPRIPTQTLDQLIAWLTGNVRLKRDWRGIATELGEQDRLAFERYPTPELKALAALHAAVGSGTAIEGLDKLRHVLLDLEHLAVNSEGDVLWRRSVESLKARPETEDSLLDRYLTHVAEQNRDDRILGIFRREGARKILREAYVRLDLAHAGALTALRPEIEDGSRRQIKRLPLTADGDDLASLLELSPADHEWVTGRWVVRGDPGAGKTTMLRNFAARVAEATRAGETLPGATRLWIPIYISLPWLMNQDNVRIERLIEKDLLDGEGLAATLDQEARAAGGGRVVLLLDSRDEVPGADLERAEDRLVDLANHWPGTPIVVATRRIGYQPFSPLFVDVDLMPLDQGRKLDFLTQWFGDPERAKDALAVVEQGLQELSTCPLYLTLMALLIEQDTEPGRLRHQLYDQVLDLLLDGKHNPDKEPIGGKKFVRAALSYLAREMTDRDAIALDVDELEALLLKNGSVRSDLETVREFGKSMRTFLDEQATRVGIVGPYAGDLAPWSFWHKSFREALVAEQLAGFDRDRLLALVGELSGQESRWGEPFALVCGRIADPDALLLQIAEANIDLALRALASVAEVKPDTVARIVDLSEDEDARAAVYTRLPAQIGEAEILADLVQKIAELQLSRTDAGIGFDLYHLDALLRGLHATLEFVEQRLARLWSLVPKPDPGMFERVPGRPEEGFWTKVPAGTFTMGTDKGDTADGPAHEVRIRSPFELARVPITVAQFAAFDGGWGRVHLRADNGDFPAASLSWFEAKAFCRWLCQLGPRVDLPSEAQWERACRGDTRTHFWCGDEDEDLARVGWYVGNSNGSAHPVARLEPNAFGLYDVHGNVWEWCEDVWHPGYLGAPDDGTPWTEGDSGFRVLRGGSWAIVADYCRAAVRGRGRPAGRIDGLGFRPARFVTE